MACYKPDNSPYYHVRFMFKGKTVRRSTKTTSVAIAKRLEAKWRNELLKKGMLDEREEISLLALSRIDAILVAFRLAST